MCRRACIGAVERFRLDAGKFGINDFRGECKQSHATSNVRLVPTPPNRGTIWRLQLRAFRRDSRTMNPFRREALFFLASWTASMKVCSKTGGNFVFFVAPPQLLEGVRHACGKGAVIPCRAAVLEYEPVIEAAVHHVQ
jgi:hypothetical protein